MFEAVGRQKHDFCIGKLIPIISLTKTNVACHKNLTKNDIDRPRKHMPLV